ncbi:uncharacterized protein cubi_00926 [Cryptosporidium ubiquitum]|uniref:Uncharacterized protein n=1 Tax=Cryptosporidium ubiquitum TaxID=857276 RepID=A0A1J4MD48_9CRYT|nr:uncharacterized protein cubi_00926 [Cryptosporidium ubiquitum]OII70781.1 hypothetical protein cubi_00926 [Cryptosporidium ubiquitum]
MFIPENVIYQVSFSEIKSKSSGGLSKFSTFDLYTQLENLDPDQLFKNFEIYGGSWLMDLSTNQLELILDQLRYILSLQLNRNLELLNQSKMESLESKETFDELQESNSFTNKLLGYILILLTRILEKKQEKFDLDYRGILDSNRFTQFELVRREIVFYQENKSLVMNWFYLFKCKEPLTKSSQLCNYLTKVYSDTEKKFLSKTKFFSEIYDIYENDWEDIEEESSVPKPKIINRRRRSNKYIFKNKAKMINIGKKRTKLKSKSKLKPTRKLNRKFKSRRR